ncbi:MAG: WD40 repeat domain-containing protein, partial [Planctomycetota bacterium]
EKLAIYNKIHLPEEEKSTVANRIVEFQVHDLIKRAGLLLDDRDYDRASKTLDEADRKATTAELQDAVASARKAIKISVSRAFDRYVDKVDQAISSDELDKARDEIDKASDLPLTTQQTETLTSRKFIIQVSSHILDAESAIKTKSFKAADESLSAAALEIDDGEGKGKTVPEGTIERLESARSSFDAELQVQFDNLLEAARSELASQDFEGASLTITKANNLPLSQDQRTSLEEFSQENRKAFESFVSELLAAITKALEENDFESARLKLEQAESLSMPEDLAATLEDLKKDFNKEAVNRHTALLNDAKAALDSKRYSDARAALDEAASIPVDAERKNKEADYNTRYTDDLNADVAAMLVEFDGFLESGKFSDASESLNAAEALPLDSELKRKVKLKREKWDAELEQVFVDKLKSAEEARDEKKFRSGSRILKEAEALPLGQAQLERLSKAEDAHKKALGSHINALFKQLEGHVKAGREKQGKLVANKLEAIISSRSDRDSLKKLRGELSGESAANRLKRLPDRMKKLFGDAVCSAEQVMWVGEEVTVVYVSADGKFAAAGTETGKVMFYNLKRGTSLGTSRGGRRKITAIGISPDGTRAMCGNDEGDLVSFTLDGSNIQTRAMGNLDDDITAITYGTGKNSLWVLTDDGNIVRYNPVTAAKVSTTPSGLSSSTAISISPNGTYLAVGGMDAEICVFNTSQMTLKKKLQGPGDDPIQRLSFSSNSKKLVAGSEGDGIGVWETGRLTEDPVKQYEDLPRWVTGVGFNSSATRVVALDDENQIRIFDTKTGKKIKTVKFEDFQDEDRDVVVTSGFVASDGTILFGTSEGEIYHFTLKK